jgi:hypothetical protein
MEYASSLRDIQQNGVVFLGASIFDISPSGLKLGIEGMTIILGIYNKFSSNSFNSLSS